MIKKKKIKLNINGGFGERLATIRKTKGVTQEELATAIGVSQRMIAYYEGHANSVFAGILPQISKVLKVSVDELLGIKPTKNEFVPKNIRLWRKLKDIEKLPSEDQKGVVHYIEALLIKHQVQ